MAAAYLFRALELGKEDLALALLHKGVKINSTTTDGVSALQFAISVGAERVVSFLIGRVADWNAKDDIGWTALHYAAYANNMDVVLMLVEKRSLDVLAKNLDGCTALDIARAKGYGKVASVLEWAMRYVMRSEWKWDIPSYLTPFFSTQAHVGAVFGYALLWQPRALLRVRGYRRQIRPHARVRHFDVGLQAVPARLL